MRSVEILETKYANHAGYVIVKYYERGKRIHTECALIRKKLEGAITAWLTETELTNVKRGQ